MTASITAALVSLALLGLFFNSTRGLAVGAVAVLVFLFPWLVVPTLIGAASAFYFFKIRKP